MLADDFGHYNVGFRGNNEARTPNMDALVEAGLILDRHYVYQYCSPTRSSFVSGRLPIHVNTANRAGTAVGGVDIRMSSVADKLAAAGYYSVQSGKWHAGANCDPQLPTSRGFNKSIGYLSGEEDHYTQTVGKNVDLWEDEAPAYGKNGTYGGFIYANHTLDAIHNCPANAPLFVYHAFQECHTPNEVPDEYLSPAINDTLRQVYEGMAHFMDRDIGLFVDALKASGKWEQTLVVFSSDNGGREDAGFGGNNYPLRGMKFTDFEGGTRVVAFASGGVIPQQMRGSTVTNLMHICDWFGTFAYLAGVDPVDHKAAANHVPLTDSVNQWPALSTPTAPNVRQEITLSSKAIIVWPYKLVLGSQGGKGWWSSPVHPNATQGPGMDTDAGCPKDGCVFNIATDPSEYVDLSASLPAVKANLTAALAVTMASAYQTNESPGYNNCIDDDTYAKAHNNFLGPICSKGNSNPAAPLAEL